MKLILVSNENQPKMYGFVCPGCKRHHRIPVEGPQAWGFNGDLNNPTFTPSLNSFYDNGPNSPHQKVCHSFITNGNIQFLGDCYHDLKNQTVALPEIDEETYWK
jgi:hypothetical protein